MRAGKILGYLVGGLIAVAALLLLSVWLLVDPNQYRGKIAAAVKDATGRELVLQGDIRLSVFPWVALELGPAALGNPPGFSKQPFVSLRHAAVRAKLLPLFHKRLEIARVEIDGLDVRLERNAAGKGNWEGFGRSEGTAQTPAPARQRPLAGLPGVKLTNARLTFDEYTLDNFNLETAPFLDGVVPISVKFEASRGVAT
jgi:AsmA protein